LPSTEALEPQMWRYLRIMAQARPFRRVKSSFHVASIALEPVETYYVYVKPPSTNDPIVTDVAGVLRKEDLSRTIDGLREAVKKKLDLELKCYGLSALVVYGPGEKKAGGRPHRGVHPTEVCTRAEALPYRREPS
jgi:hypothetical protein